MIKIDEIDERILEELTKDGRATYAEIAEKVHLSRVSVRDRIIQLKNKGVIDQFTIMIDVKKIGKSVAVFFDIEVNPKQIDFVAAEIGKYEQVSIVYQMTGATNLHVHAFLEDIESLSTFMNKELYTIKGIKNINSYILLKRYKSVFNYI